MNFALNKPVWTTNNGTEYPPSNAVDGNFSTFADIFTGDWPFLAIDLEARVTLITVIMRVRYSEYWIHLAPFCVLICIFMEVFWTVFGKSAVYVTEVYKNKGPIFQEESYLPWISRFSSLDLHTFNISTLYFGAIFSSVNMASRPQRSARSACFGRWRCDHYVTMQVHQSSQPITHCEAYQPRVGNNRW